MTNLEMLESIYQENINKTPNRIEINLHFTDNQFERLSEGILMQHRYDTWSIIFLRDAFYFKRERYVSFKTQLIKEKKGYFIKEFWAEDEREECYDEEKGADLFSLLIGRATIDQDTIKSVLFGVAVADALGVPFEFLDRETMKKKPVTDMVGYGTYNLPPGTFSDDSSLTFCLAEAIIIEGFDLNTIGQNFVKWRDNNYWTARGKVFDIGHTTNQAINQLVKGVKPDLAGGFDEASNGNGSLMRISALLFFLLHKRIKMRFEVIKQVSSITHGHIRSVIACFYYLEFCRLLVTQKDKFEIYKKLQTKITSFLKSKAIYPPLDLTEITMFDRLLKQNIYELKEEDIFSSGYVLHTLEASIWCLLTTNNYKDAVLKAVNLGGDTDTTAAVTGAMAGLLYGLDGIPDNWIKQLARHDDVADLAERLDAKVFNRLNRSHFDYRLS